MSDEETRTRDVASAINAVSQLHGGITYLLESKCIAYVQFEDGQKIELDLSEAISFIIGVELGMTMGAIMNAKNRQELMMVPDNVLLKEKQVLATYIATKMAEGNKENQE